MYTHLEGLPLQSRKARVHSVEVVAALRAFAVPRDVVGGGLEQQCPPIGICMPFGFSRRAARGGAVASCRRHATVVLHRELTWPWVGGGAAAPNRKCTAQDNTVYTNVFATKDPGRTTAKRAVPPATRRPRARPSARALRPSVAYGGAERGLAVSLHDGASAGDSLRGAASCRGRKRRRAVED